MPSVSVSQVPQLVANDGYPVMFQSYEDLPQVAPLICEMVTEFEPSMYGDKGSVIVGFGPPKVTRDGAEIEADTFESAYTWYCVIDRLTRRLDIPKRLMDASDGAAKVGNMVAEAGKRWGVSFAQEKEQRVADLFQKGTLSAGHIATFNGTFPNNADPYPKYIYDGKPFFAATGNGHVLAANSATPFNLVVSAALSSTTLQTTLTAMRDTNAIDDRGQKIVIQPKHLIVPPGLEYTAKTLVNSTNVPGSTNNDVNTLQGILQPITWRFLTDDTDAWFVGAGQGVRVYDSGPPQFETDYDVKTQTMVVTATSYHGRVVTDWRGYFANNKATS
jgi:hypothetical protein